MDNEAIAISDMKSLPSSACFYIVSLCLSVPLRVQSFKKIFLICLVNPNIVPMLCMVKQFFIRNVISYETLITFYQCLKMVIMKDKINLIFKQLETCVFKYCSYKFSGHGNSQWENIPKSTHHYLPYLLLIPDKIIKKQVFL